MRTLIRSALPAVLLLLAITVPGSALAHQASDCDGPRQRKPHAQPKDYKPVEVLGWTLRVNNDLLADKELYQQVRDEVYHQLFRITRVVPEDKVELLQKVTIWIELDNPYTDSCQYHASARWLINNGYIAEKAKGVDIGNAKRFLNESGGRQPYLLLHELAHAYHNQHLGYNQAEIVKAYRDAKEAGIYEKVLFSNGRYVRAYAMTNQMEYFAELTEAFFGMNDFYPFVRAELKVHDPQGYEVVKAVWGVK